MHPASALCDPPPLDLACDVGKPRKHLLDRPTVLRIWDLRGCGLSAAGVVKMLGDTLSHHAFAADTVSRIWNQTHYARVTQQHQQRKRRKGVNAPLWRASVSREKVVELLRIGERSPRPNVSVVANEYGIRPDMLSKIWSRRIFRSVKFKDDVQPMQKLGDELKYLSLDTLDKENVPPAPTQTPTPTLERTPESQATHGSGIMSPRMVINVDEPDLFCDELLDLPWSPPLMPLEDGGNVDTLWQDLSLGVDFAL